MAYTKVESKAMYAEAVEKLTDAAVEFRNFIDAEPVDAEPELKQGTQQREEVRFAEQTVNTLTNLIGNCKVRERQAAAGNFE